MRSVKVIFSVLMQISDFSCVILFRLYILFIFCLQRNAGIQNDQLKLGRGDKYTRSGKPIYIKLSVTPDGAIISTLTVEQYESEKIGDKCGDESYYSQFNGKTEENYVTVDNISGATYTSDGYKSAIKNAFEAINLYEEGAE